MALLWERRAECPGMIPIIAAHDEIVLEVPLAQADVAKDLLARCMIEAMAPLLDPIPLGPVVARIIQTWDY